MATHNDTTNDTTRNTNREQTKAEGPNRAAPTRPSDGRPYDGVYRHDDVSADRIESRIRETRSDMDVTLDELGRRFEPSNLLKQFLGGGGGGGGGSSGFGGEDISEALGKAGRQISDRVKQHPIPAALMGVGALWMLSEKASGSNADGSAMASGAAHARDAAGSAGHAVSRAARSAGHSMGDAAHATAHAVGDSAHSAGDWIADSANSAAHSVSDAGHRAASFTNEQAHRAAVATADAYEDRPLLFGLAAVAAGLAAGAVIPGTGAERRAFGSTAKRWRDRIGEEGRHAAEAAIDSASEGFVEGADELGQQIESKVDRASEAAQPDRNGSDADSGDGARAEQAEHRSTSRFATPAGG